MTPLWGVCTRSFDGMRLREAIVVRGWGIEEFRIACGLSERAFYNALGSRVIRDATARRILELLASREPSLRLVG